MVKVIQNGHNPWRNHALKIVIQNSNWIFLDSKRCFCLFLCFILLLKNNIVTSSYSLYWQKIKLSGLLLINIREGRSKVGPSPCFLSPSPLHFQTLGWTQRGEPSLQSRTRQGRCLIGGGKATGLSHNPVPSHEEAGEEPNAAFLQEGRPEEETHMSVFLRH